MRKRTKKKIFWGKIRDRISSVVRKINWQYIAIVAIIIIGVCVLIASYFICNNDAKNIAVGIGTGIVTSALVTMYLELINSRIEKRKVERYKRMLLNPLAEAVDAVFIGSFLWCHAFCTYIISVRSIALRLIRYCIIINL